MARLPGSRTRLWKRQPVARDRAWQSMRILRTFTQADLVATAEISRQNAKKYVSGLVRSGYLMITKQNESGKTGSFTSYRLVRNTGPKAPRLQSDGNTWDPNEHRTYSGGIKQ